MQGRLFAGIAPLGFIAVEEFSSLLALCLGLRLEKRYHLLSGERKVGVPTFWGPALSTVALATGRTDT